MSYNDVNKNEPADDIDWLFELNEWEVPLAGRAFAETLKNLRAAEIQPLAQRRAAMSFGWSSIAAALALTAASVAISLLLLFGGESAQPTSPAYSLSANLSTTQAAVASVTAEDKAGIGIEAGVLSDGSRVFPQYLDYTQVARANKKPNPTELSLPGSSVPQLDRFGDNTAPKVSPNNNFRRQIG